MENSFRGSFRAHLHSQPNDFALQSEEIWLPKMVWCVYSSVQAAAVDWEQGGSCLSLPAMDLFIYSSDVPFHVFWGIWLYWYQ